MKVKVTRVNMPNVLEWKTMPRAVQRLDKDTLEVLQNYDKIIDTADEGFTPSCVSRCCRAYKQTVHRGFRWRYSSNDIKEK